MIIAAHNYNSHFGRISSLNSGDEVIFTDTEGCPHRYVVDYTQYVDGYDIDGIFSGQEVEWALTLFTCTLGGKRRVTVRCERAETGETGAGSRLRDGDGQGGIVK